MQFVLFLKSNLQPRKCNSYPKKHLIGTTSNRDWMTPAPAYCHFRPDVWSILWAPSAKAPQNALAHVMCLSSRKEHWHLGHWLCLPTAARTDLWEPVGPPRLNEVYTRKGVMPGVGTAPAQHMERDPVPSPWAGAGPASSQTQLVAVRRWWVFMRTRSTWGECRDKTHFQQGHHVRRGERSSALPRTQPGRCISPLMVLGILALCSSLTPVLSCSMSCSSAITDRRAL